MKTVLNDDEVYSDQRWDQNTCPKSKYPIRIEKALFSLL